MTAGNGCSLTAGSSEYVGSTKILFYWHCQHEEALIDHLLTWALSQAAAHSHRVLHQRLREAGFTGYGYRILSALGTGESFSQTELGRRAALDRSDVTAGVRHLEAQGWVGRRGDAHHGRRLNVTITAAGRKAWDEVQPVMAAVQEEVFGSLDEQEREQLRSLLRRIPSSRPPDSAPDSPVDR